MVAETQGATGPFTDETEFRSMYEHEMASLREAFQDIGCSNKAEMIAMALTVIEDLDAENE